MAVDVRHRAVVEDPFADGDVPAAVRIGEQRQARRVEEQDKQAHADDQRP
jgi:hypothetical protein